MKARYLKKKKASGLSKHALSRSVYELTKEPFHIEELRLKLDLPSTRSYDLTKEERSNLARLLLHGGHDHRGLEADEL